MNLHFIFLISCILSFRIVASDLSELCKSTTNGDFENCLFTINTTERCREENKAIVNRHFSELLLKMNLERMDIIQIILRNHINAMILQLNSEMLAFDVCRNYSFPHSFTVISNNLDSHLISPLESSLFISSGFFYIDGTNQTLKAWKNYLKKFNDNGIMQQEEGFNGTEYELYTEQEFGNKTVPNRAELPQNFLTIYLNQSNTEDIKRVPRIENDIKWSGPFLTCANGNYLRLELELPIYALTNCTGNVTHPRRFTKVGFANFEVPFSLIDFNQCMGDDTLRINSCPSNSTCRKTKYKSNLSKFSYECICNRGFYISNISEHSEDRTCYKCHPSCFSCTSSDRCYSIVLRSVLLACNALIMVICVCLIIFTVVFSYIWKQDSLIGSSPPFLLLILIGSLLMYTSLIIEYFPPSVLTCTLNPWFFYPGFSLAFGSLILLSWRIIKIYNNSKNWTHNLKPKRSIDWHLFLRLLPFIFITVVSLIAWTISNKMPGPQDPDLQEVAFLYCRQDDWGYLIIVANLLLIVFGILLSIKARLLPSIYQETRDILFSIYNITIVNAICTLASQTLYLANPEVNFVILFVNLHLGITFMIFIMFRKKVMDVFQEKILHKRKQKPELDKDLAEERKEKMRFLEEMNQLRVLLKAKQIKINELSKECGDFRSDSANEDLTSENGDRENEIRIVIDPPVTTENIEMTSIPIYMYEKRDSATESEIHMSLKDRNDSLSSPISTDSTD